MFTTPDNIHQTRLDRLRLQMVETGIDTLMVLVAENRRYLSGFTGADTQFDESAGVLFVTPAQQVLATDSRFETQAESESPLFRVYCHKKGLIKAFPDILSGLNTQRLGIESIRMSVKDRDGIVKQFRESGMNVELVATEDLVETQRLIKSADEIEQIRAALVIAESAFQSFLGCIKPGMTEIEAAWILEKLMREGGADALSFPVIAASGPNSALPHAIPTARPFMPGEPLLFDWGTKLNGYCSDISRTVVLGSKESTFQKIFTIVLDAQRKAIDAVRPGVDSQEIDRIARDHIDKKGYKEHFGHGLGHGVGLAVHESPRISPLKTQTLKPGMVFTVEPGIYLPGWGGIRLENMVQVTEDGVAVLNRRDIMSEYRPI